MITILPVTSVTFSQLVLKPKLCFQAAVRAAAAEAAAEADRRGNDAHQREAGSVMTAGSPCTPLPTMVMPGRAAMQTMQSVHATQSSSPVQPHGAAAPCFGVDAETGPRRGKESMLYKGFLGCSVLPYTNLVWTASYTFCWRLLHL